MGLFLIYDQKLGLSIHRDAFVYKFNIRLLTRLDIFVTFMIMQSENKMVSSQHLEQITWFDLMFTVKFPLVKSCSQKANQIQTSWNT